MAIPPLLASKDSIEAAKTGSGKMLAGLSHSNVGAPTKFTNRNGMGTIVIAPTCELAMQIYGVCKELFTLAFSDLCTHQVWS